MINQEASVSIVFVGIEPSNVVRAHAVKKVGAVVTSDSEVRSCRVVLEGNHHSHIGHRYRAKIELSVGRTALVVGSQGEAFTDLYAAIDAAVGDAKRVLHQRAARAHHLSSS
jgi:ribosome-associated translation inhibitor RaiA